MVKSGVKCRLVFEIIYMPEALHGVCWLRRASLSVEKITRLGSILRFRSTVNKAAFDIRIGGLGLRRLDYPCFRPRLGGRGDKFCETCHFLRSF